MPDSSQRERITQYIQDTYGTEAEYLWADSPGNAIFRHSASKKWYAALMRVLPEKLGLTGVEALDVMDIKCSTIMIGSLLATKGFLPAYHCQRQSEIVRKRRRNFVVLRRQGGVTKSSVSLLK